MRSKILGSREVKEVQKQVKEQWGCELSTDCAFSISSKSRIYIISRDVAKIDYEKLRIDVFGLYVAEIVREGLRLSIEGSQIVGPLATKNVADVDSETMRKWLKGEDVEIKNTEGLSGFVILRHNNDYLGSGKFKEGKILNFVPKNRRILSD